MESQTTSESDKALELKEWQLSIIEMFVHLAQAIGLQKSIGQIYGLLYASVNPLSLDDIQQMLQISKGSASQGLKTLKGLRAVKMVFVPGSRKDHYEAEVELKRLVGGFFASQIEFQIKDGEDRISNIRTLFEQETSTTEDIKVLNNRIEKLSTWLKKSHRLLPLIKKLIGNS